MTRKNGPTAASALPRTLSIALLFVAAILLASSFEAAQFSQERTANLDRQRAVTSPVAARSSRLGGDGALRLVRISANSPRTSQPRQLSLADRYAYQRAIEEVYWRHRIWPKERPEPKPSLDEAMGRGHIEQKVENSRRNCRVLEEYWQQPIRAAQLQAEMNRMARHTRQPEVLRELFAALGNDPFVIAECLAKSVLSERLVSNLMRDPLDRSREGGLRSAILKSTEPPPVESFEYVLPAVAESSAGFSGISGSQGCTDNTWTATAIEVPQARTYHTGVWTGSEMIVWGGIANGRSLKAGSRYNPATDSWTPISATNAPEARSGHAAIWTGSEMIIWGGFDGSDPLSTGGRYNPGTDTWVPTSLTNAPEAGSATAVWTGSEMITWGGVDDGSITFNAGRRYNPATDSWTPISVTNAPEAPGGHTAIWTGSEMIVWGGFVSNRGGKYNPQTDSWTATSLTNAPQARFSHTAIWTGSEMIVWGGLGSFNVLLNSGGKYDPETDSWTPTSLTNAPQARFSHTAVWTGSEMIVWGGAGGGSNTGRKYDPGTDSWTAVSQTTAPEGRVSHTAVWTGSEMIVWGGDGDVSNRGGRYDPQTDTWTETNVTSFAPVRRHDHTAVWTGNEMIIWGGTNSDTFVLNSGGKYNPGTDSWVATSLINAPEARHYHTAVWTGIEMIIWGGGGVNAIGNTGGRYNPQTDTWTATSLIGAPEARADHSAVWTGSEMIIWGGGNDSNTGGRYNPGTDSWTPTSLTIAPVGRHYHTAVWTGSEMIVWGGYNSNIGPLNSGGRYNPGTDSWTATSLTNAPEGRLSHTAVWTGSEMIIWGGGYVAFLNTGGRYDPGTDSWTATSLSNAPVSRRNHTAVWTGSEMIIWSGYDGNDYLSSGGRYDAGTNRWGPTSPTNAPVGREYHTAVWTGNEMIIWGGYDLYDKGDLNSGGRLCGQSGPTTLANISTRHRVETGDRVGIGGFIVTGTQPKQVIVRAIGPSLPLPGAVPNPILELRNSSGELIRSNDNWRSDQEPEIVATGIPPANDLESAIVETLPANGSAYTALLRGADNGMGIGLVEVYDLDRTVDSKLANISTRGFVGTGDNVMIGGTIVQGVFSSSVILRGIGPSLANAGVPNVLADPTLELRDGNGVLLVTNDNWQDDSASAAQLIAHGLAPQPLESGIFVSLAPGAYTAILAGKNNGTGVGLVEAYQVQ